MTDAFPLDDVINLSRAHSLALQQIPGIRVAEVLLRGAESLFDEKIFCCIGHCPKCDSYWREFRTTPGLTIEVIYVGYTKPTTPA